MMKEGGSGKKKTIHKATIKRNESKKQNNYGKKKLWY